MPPLQRARAAAQQAVRRVGQPSRHLYLPRRQVAACLHDQWVMRCDGQRAGHTHAFDC